MELVILPKQHQQQQQNHSSRDGVIFEMESSTTSSPPPPPTHQLFSTTSNPTTTAANNNNNNNNNNNSSSCDSSTTSTSAARRRVREFDNLSLDMRKHPRVGGGGGDLLRTFLSTSDPITDNHFLLHRHNNKQQLPISISQRELKLEQEEEAEAEEDELELNLGLSLGGRFGVDKTRNGLVRSSSIAGTIMPSSLIRDEDDPTTTMESKKLGVAIPPLKISALVRTTSLPTETEEEWRRRKEIQTLRRMEAKRRRSEKQKVMLTEGFPNNFTNPNHPPSSTSGITTATAAAAAGVESGIKVKRGFFSSLHGLLARQQQQQQGSDPASGVESQISSAAATATVVHPETKGKQEGSSQVPMNPARTQSLPVEQQGINNITQQQPDQERNNNNNKRKESADGVGGDMPCVFTIGDGPNGRKVEGILYKYGKGEEVRIMCVCHGSFFSPAQFVKHAGGRDVDHPLRHIVVNPSS